MGVETIQMRTPTPRVVEVTEDQLLGYQPIEGPRQSWVITLARRIKQSFVYSRFNIFLDTRHYSDVSGADYRVKPPNEPFLKDSEMS